MNYTADPFQFSVVDPRDEKNNGGGEHIGPYAAGGIICCFKLPAKWSPGTTVEIQSRYWLASGDGKETSAIETKHTVEVPAYASGKAGELWVMRRGNGSIDIVSSDLQPDHPQWPGKVKGWPVPSREFMLERWELEREDAEHSIKNHKKHIAELEQAPESTLQRMWVFDRKYRQDEIATFTGPNDQAYKQYLSKRHTEGLRWSEARLEQVMKGKP